MEMNHRARRDALEMLKTILAVVREVSDPKEFAKRLEELEAKASAAFKVDQAQAVKAAELRDLEAKLTAAAEELRIHAQELVVARGAHEQAINDHQGNVVAWNITRTAQCAALDEQQTRLDGIVKELDIRAANLDSQEAAAKATYLAGQRLLVEREDKVAAREAAVTAAEENLKIRARRAQEAIAGAMP